MIESITDTGPVEKEEVKLESTPEDDPHICPVCGEAISWACGCSCIRDEDWGKMAETGLSEASGEKA